MSKEFDVYKLGDVSKIFAGGDKPQEFSDIQTEEYNVPIYANGETNLGLQGFAKIAKVNVPAVTVSARGTIGFAVLRMKPFVPIVRLLTLIPNVEKLDLLYLYHYLKLYRQSGIGSSQAQLIAPEIANRTIRLPNLSIQKSIGKVLSILDSKIELNNRINAELEVMAKTLYDYWFVQFDFPDKNGKPYKTSGGTLVWNEQLKREIPEGWEVDNILRFGELLGGGTPKTKEPIFWNGNIPFYTPADHSGSFFSLTTKENITVQGLDSCSSKLHSKGTVFITARGSVGKINIASKEMAMNQSCYAFKPRPEINYYYLHQCVIDFVHYLKAKSSGSIFDAIVSNDIKFTPIVIAPKELISNYGKLVGEQYEKILINSIENEKLAELRDWLLPILMNGQVKVN